ncbi:MAG: VOC family protein [Luteolibacter sp.]
MSTTRNPVGWFEIYVEDMERAKSFYEKTFETTLEQLPAPDIEMLAFPMGGGESGEDCSEKPGCPGALVKMEGCEPGGGGTLIYFSCEDCSVEESRVESAGGKVFKPKFSIGEYGFIALVSDTEGNMIGLHSIV